MKKQIKYISAGMLAGMLLCGSWYTGTFQTDSEEFYQKIGWFPFPAIDDSDADLKHCRRKRSNPVGIKR